MIRQAREETGLSQRELAFRAGTTHAAVSRIESGKVSPTCSTLSGWLYAMGRELSMTAAPLEIDPVHVRSTEARSSEERPVLAIGWNRLVARLAVAGEKARGGA